MRLIESKIKTYMWYLPISEGAPYILPIFEKIPYLNFRISLYNLYISLFGFSDLPTILWEFPSLFNHSPYLKNKISLFVTSNVSHVWWRARGFTRFFHNQSMEIFPDAQGQLTPQSLVQSGQISLVRDAIDVLFTCKYEEDPIKNEGVRVFTRFSPFITLWDLSVVMETRVPIRSGPKPNAAFPPSQWCV